jgi:hypothetical protein
VTGRGPVPLPMIVRGWLEAGGAAVLGTVDLTGHARLTPVAAVADGDDVVLPVAEGSPAHHDLIYDPTATVLVCAPFDPMRSALIRGEVEMTTAGAGELAARLLAEGSGGEWLVVRVVPTSVDVLGPDGRPIP